MDIQRNMVLLTGCFAFMFLLPSCTSTIQNQITSERNPLTRAKKSTVTTTRHPCFDACSYIYVDIRTCMYCMRNPAVIKSMQEKTGTYAPGGKWVPAVTTPTTTTTMPPGPLSYNKLLSFCVNCMKGRYDGVALQGCLIKCHSLVTASSFGNKLTDEFSSLTTTTQPPVPTVTLTAATTKKNTNVPVNNGNNNNNNNSNDNKFLSENNSSEDLYVMNSSAGKKLFMVIAPSMIIIVSLLVVIVLLLQKGYAQNARRIRMLQSLPR